MSWFDPAVSNSNGKTILLTNHASDRKNFPMFEEFMPSLSKFLLRQHTRQFLSFSRPRLVSSEPYTSFSNLVSQKKNAIWFFFIQKVYILHFYHTGLPQKSFPIFLCDFLLFPFSLFPQAIPFPSHLYFPFFPRRQEYFIP